MFARIKKSGKYQYLQIVENRRDDKKISQRVIATIGRLDKLKANGGVDPLIRSLSRFSEKTLIVLSGKSDIKASSKKIGPSLIFERLWENLGIKKVIKHMLQGRKFEFDIERAVFLTVLNRLFASGSDRSCDKWRRDYAIRSVESLSLHHMYRAMAFLGEELKEQKKAAQLSPRCIKDVIEERMFSLNQDLFSRLDLVFFDTTSIYFEGEGGKTIGQRGHTKDHRPDLKQMVLGAVLDNNGKPICCEMWPGNTADVKTLIPVAERLRKRFNVIDFCIVADRGMISNATMDQLAERKMPYILGSRMRKVNEVKHDALSRGGRYKEVYPEGNKSKDPSPLKVKEVLVGENRYIICYNSKQARKDAADRQAILESLRQKLKSGAKSMIGNKGYRKYLTISQDSIAIDLEKVESEARFDGKWVLKTNTDLPTEQVALKYKELWQVEHVFRDLKSVLDTRPVFHKCDETIRGHIFCSYLALTLRKELDRLLEKNNHNFEWKDIKQDLKALQETIVEENEKQLLIRTQSIGTCGKVFQAVGIAMPPTIREA